MKAIFCMLLHPSISIEGRRVMFYTLFVLLLISGTVTSFYFGWPKNILSDRMRGIIDAPTLISDAPKGATTSLSLIAGESTTTGKLIETITATTSAVVSLEGFATSSATSTKSGATTPTTAAPVVTPPIETPVDQSLKKDILPPSVPKNLIVQYVSSDEVVINWSRSLDNASAVAYKIFLNGKQVADTTKTIQIFTHLEPKTKYTFGVVAYDASGNLSKMNNILTETVASDEAAIEMPPPTPSPAPTPAPTPDPVVAPSPAIPLSLCGNGVQNSGEECDDGNNIDGDSCTNACKAARCGDGVVNIALEQCDDGNNRDGDYCTNQCQNHTPTALQISIWGLDAPPAPSGD
jgi:cysteine-rich repeat protein